MLQKQHLCRIWTQSWLLAWHARLREDVEGLNDEDKHSSEGLWGLVSQNSFSKRMIRLGKGSKIKLITFTEFSANGGGPEVEKIILFLCKFSAKNRDYCDFSKGVKGNPKSNIIVCVQT